MFDLQEHHNFLCLWTDIEYGSTTTTLFMVISVKYTICEGPKLDA